MRKTSVVLAAFCDAQKVRDRGLKAAGKSAEYRHANRLRALVIAPRRVVHRVWPLEARKWAEFNHLHVAITHGSPRIRERAVKEDADLYVVTHDGAQWFCDGGWIDKCGVEVLIIDELSKYKRSSTARHKHFRKYLPKFSIRWGMTGSFMPKSLLDTFGQVYMLDEGRALGKWFTHFRSEFFSPGGYGGYIWTPKPDSARVVLARLKETCISLEAADYVKLPQLTIDDRTFDLPPDVRVQYLEMQKELLTFVEDERISAPNAAVAMMKCRQIASGGLYMGPDDAVLVHEEKLDILEELLDELQGAPIFVIYEFRFEAEAVQHRFGSKTRRIPVLGGGTSDKAADAMLDAWNRNEEPLMLVHPQSGGHGINAQEGNCSHILALTCPYDFEAWDQVIRRVYRSGNKSERIFLHRALAHDTIEQDVAKVLLQKENRQRDFVSALKMRARAFK